MEGHPMTSLLKIIYQIKLSVFIIVIASNVFSQEIKTKQDSLLLKELEKELGQVQNKQTKGTTPAFTNPELSVIGDFQGVYKSIGKRKTDAFIKEVEISLGSAVDPYVRADFFLSFHREEETGEFNMAMEEGFLTTLSLPAQLQLKIGKFRSNFGKLNLVHPHANNFIDIPLVIKNYFGEALIDEGFSLSWLVPNPFDFYQDLTIQVTRGPDENNSFTRSEESDFLYLAHLKNFWDLSDNSTLEIGFSAGHGPNDSLLTTFLGGLNITYKWKPLQFKQYKSFEFQTEFLWSDRQILEYQHIKSFGMYAFVTWQLAQRWFATSRFDYSNLPNNNKWNERALSGIIGWYASEFQKVELQFKRTIINNFYTVNQVMLRSVFVIGAHGAHQY
jgi:hypothetical protein